MCNDLTYEIADFKKVKNRVDTLKHRSDDVKSRLAATLKLLWNPKRQLQLVSADVDFSSLRLNFPQFEEVIEFYENTAISLARLGLPFEIPPILLEGDPGLGKTFFASELCKCLQLPFYEISLATMSASFALGGGNIQWSEGETGFIANTLAKSEVANPVILIDEIDKSGGSNRYAPLNIFYSLLESHSAKRFKDEALEFELDASKIIWMATANYTDYVPDPILSRMRRFKIEQPSVKAMTHVVHSIYAHILQSKAYGKLLSRTLDDSVVTCLSLESPRSIKLCIEVAAFKAIREQRDAIRLSDLPVFKKEKQRVGFI